MRCLKRMQMVVAVSLHVMLIGSITPMYAGAYKSVRPWEVMPDGVESWMNQAGLKAAYDGKRWPEFRNRANELVSRSDLSKEQALYLRLVIAQSGAARNPLDDPAELALRIRYLNEADTLALSAPGDHHQALGSVHYYLAMFSRAAGDSSGELRAWKNLVERFYDVRFAIGAPEYWPTLTNTYDMPDLFAAAGESPEDAVAYLRGLVRQHPVREFRFMALLALGRQYALMEDLSNVAYVVREADRDFADLMSLPEFKINLTALRFMAEGKGHAQPAPGRGGDCCGGKH